MLNSDATRDQELSFICYGELLWDLFPEGAQLGGSSANVAVNLLRLGAHPWLVSRVGCDELGTAAIRELQSIGIDTTLIQRDTVAPTGQVAVTLTRGEPRFTIASESAWDRIEVQSRHFDLLARSAGFIFGTLAQRTPMVKEALRDLLSARPASCRTLCDLNLRPPHYDKQVVDQALRLADVVKLNESELEHVATLLGTDTPVTALFDGYPLSMIAVTRAERGCTLFTRSERIDHAGFPLLSGEGDAVGAGDAFTAALAVELAKGTSVLSMAHKANELARRVASARGGFGFVA